MAGLVKLKDQFDSYYASAVESASIMMHIKEGDASKFLEKMLEALQALKTTLTESQTKAAQEFSNGMSSGQLNVERAFIFFSSDISIKSIPKDTS